MENKYKYLYRGVSEEMHHNKKGLLPRGSSFTRTIIIGEHHEGGDGFVIGLGVVGDCQDNAVIAHQRDSKVFPSSGISTTPFFERAKFYATHKGEKKRGIVYKIDRFLLSEKAIKQYRVKDYIEFPEIPEDDEIILVKDDNAALPQEIVSEVITVTLDT
jgi:hypothetical protein